MASIHRRGREMHRIVTVDAEPQNLVYQKVICFANKMTQSQQNLVQFLVIQYFQNTSISCSWLQNAFVGICDIY